VISRQRAGRRAGSKFEAGAEQVQRCRGAEWYKSGAGAGGGGGAGASAEVQRCRGAEVQWCLDGGAEAHQVQMLY
jgi:hypothetical protein